MKVELIKYPTAEDWLLAKRCTLTTVGKDTEKEISEEMKRGLLNARHSPIRELKFTFKITEVPYWVSVHLCRHIHAQPYVRTQRNDRQSDYDRNDAPQSAPVTMMWSMNAEELMVVCNKRLCNKASPETRKVVQEMKKLVEEQCPEFKGFLVPMCEYQGRCHELQPCGRTTFESRVKLFKQSIEVIEDNENISGRSLREILKEIGI